MNENIRDTITVSGTIIVSGIFIRIMMIQSHPLFPQLMSVLGWVEWAPQRYYPNIDTESSRLLLAIATSQNKTCTKQSISRCISKKGFFDHYDATWFLRELFLGVHSLYDDAYPLILTYRPDQKTVEPDAEGCIQCKKYSDNGVPAYRQKRKRTFYILWKDFQCMYNLDGKLMNILFCIPLLLNPICSKNIYY